MGKLMVSCVVFLWIFSLCEMVKGCYKSCNFPAIYNFGDSNSDTGGISATYFPSPPPNGESYFGRPAGRVCDGRLIIDFMDENLRLPYLHAYLDSLGANFRHGANFATGGSSIRTPTETIFENGISPFPLTVQISQFDQFKARSTYLYKQAKKISEKAYLPNPDEFSRALYTFDIGQNDLSYAFGKMPDDKIRALIPDMIVQFSAAIQKLYQLGARSFWIHNTGPIGCSPASRFYFSGGSELLDQYGCIKSHNEIAAEFNKQLKDRVYQLRTEIKDAAITHVDIYTAKYQLISNAKNEGFGDPMKICCGNHDQTHHVGCGQKQNVNGTEIYCGSCENPSMYISWDGVHYTQAANHWIANRILTGALSDPPLSLAQACNCHS